jgi:anaerobic dimethyl sulfoxide reductase subunit C (anchor subunit)
VREGSLVAFTLLTQAAVGTTWVLLADRWWAGRTGEAMKAVESGAWPVAVATLVAALLGLAATFLHLGRPRNAWRALANLRSSWLSREILFAAAFTAALAAGVLLRLPPGPAGFAAGFADGFAAVIGLGLLWAMAMAYRLRSVSPWNTASTPVAFFGTALALGLLAVATALALNRADPELPAIVPHPLVLGALLVLVVEAASALRWLRRLASGGGAEREAFARIGVERRRLLSARLVLEALALAATAVALLTRGAAWPVAAALALAFAAEASGRVLFYEARVRSGL